MRRARLWGLSGGRYKIPSPAKHTQELDTESKMTPQERTGQISAPPDPNTGSPQLPLPTPSPPVHAEEEQNLQIKKGQLGGSRTQEPDSRVLIPAPPQTCTIPAHLSCPLSKTGMLPSHRAWDANCIPTSTSMNTVYGGKKGKKGQGQEKGVGVGVTRTKMIGVRKDGAAESQNCKQLF